MSHANPALSRRAAHAVTKVLSDHYRQPIIFEPWFEHSACPGCFGMIRRTDNQPLPLFAHEMEATVRQNKRLQDNFPGIEIKILRISTTGQLDIKLPLEGEC